MFPTIKDVSALYIPGKITDFHLLANELHRRVIYTASEMDGCIPVYPADDPVVKALLQPFPVIKCQDKMYKKYGIRMYINLLVECGFATGKIFLIL